MIMDDRVWIWDTAKTYEELVERAREQLRREIKEEYWDRIDNVLSQENIVKQIAGFSLIFKDFVRGVKAVMIGIDIGKTPEKAATRRMWHERNMLDRCTWTDELKEVVAGLSTGISKELGQKLIDEAKAVRSANKIIVHPLLLAIVKDWQKKHQV